MLRLQYVRQLLRAELLHFGTKGVNAEISVAGRPVPVESSEPIMTFSLKPFSMSTLPNVEASVRTRVVSWKDAAEMKDSVSSDALVIPRRTGSPSAAYHLPLRCGH